MTWRRAPHFNIGVIDEPTRGPESDDAIVSFDVREPAENGGANDGEHSSVDRDPQGDDRDGDEGYTRPLREGARSSDYIDDEVSPHGVVVAAFYGSIYHSVCNELSRSV